MPTATAAHRSACASGLIQKGKLVREAVQLSQANAKELLARKKAGLSTREILSDPEKSSVIVAGVPAFVTLHGFAASKIFRHYTAREAVEAIVHSGWLKAGTLPYITVGGGIRRTYEDLTGVFVTTPEFRPEFVGLARGADKNYVDFYFHRGTAVVEIEKGILLVPGKQDFPGWLKAEYRKWRDGHYVPPEYEKEMLARMEQAGIEPATVPIRIVRYAVDGKAFRVVK